MKSFFITLMVVAALVYGMLKLDEHTQPRRLAEWQASQQEHIAKVNDELKLNPDLVSCKYSEVGELKIVHCPTETTTAVDHGKFGTSSVTVKAGD
jgi:hypothetical protein